MSDTTTTTHQPTTTQRPIGHCHCGRPAYKLKFNEGVCQRCDSIEHSRQRDSDAQERPRRVVNRSIGLEPYTVVGMGAALVG